MDTNFILTELHSQLKEPVEAFWMENQKPVHGFLLMNKLEILNCSRSENERFSIDYKIDAVFSWSPNPVAALTEQWNISGTLNCDANGSAPVLFAPLIFSKSE